MSVYNKYLISLVAALSAANIIVSAFGQTKLDIYVIANILVYLVVTMLFVYLNRRAARALGAIVAVLMVAFGVLIALRVVEVLRA